MSNKELKWELYKTPYGYEGGWRKTDEQIAKEDAEYRAKRIKVEAKEK